MDVAIHHEFLTVNQNNDVIIKELPLANDGVIQTFHFQTPYDMQLHGSAEYGPNWCDGHIPVS